MDSLKGRRGGHISDPLPLTPRIPRHRAARPAVPGGIAAFPLSCLCVTELRVRFPRNPYEDPRCRRPAAHFRLREWTYYDSFRSPLSNSRVQLRGHMSEYPSYADIQTQRRFGVGTPVRGSSFLRLVPPHIPAANPNGCHWCLRRKVGCDGTS